VTEGRTILCFASGYDAPPTSKHHVMHLLAERNTVLWVNYHASRRPGASKADLFAAFGKLKQIFGGLKQRRENLHVLTPFALPLPGSRLARRLNRWMLGRRIRRALRRLKADRVDVWSFAPDVAYLLDRLPVDRVVYYCVDDFSQFEGYDMQQVLADEADLAGRADLVVTTAESLQAAKAPLNANTMLVPHGVDFDHFATALTETDLPADLAGIPAPRLGFFGLIHEWVDVELLAEVARRQPAWQLVLIGQANTDLSPLQELSNVHVLGSRPYDTLPGYCRSFDVGLIPFVVNELTRSVNPIKLREYLAAGLSVVSTPLPEVAKLQPHAMIADGVDAFVAAIETAIATPSIGRIDRRDAVRDDGWRAKVDAVCNALERETREGQR
jgi:hypothetical protein